MPQPAVPPKGRRERWLAALIAPALLLLGGCEPTCREVEPMGQVRDELRERVDERMDLADATDAQRAQIQALFTGTLPAVQHMRAETLPRQRELVAELRREIPDRVLLGALIDKNLAAARRYLHANIDAMLRAHRLLTPAQRKLLVSKASEPSEAFEGSFLLDRAVDYLLSRIDATAEQRNLVERMKLHLLRRGRAFQRQTDRFRAEAAAEFINDQPDRKHIDDTIERGLSTTRQALVELTGYYLLFASKLDPKQRQVLNAELVRVEPCPTQASLQRSALDQTHL